MPNKRKYQHRRTSSTKRGYGSAWQKARKAYLKKHPDCEHHLRFNRVVDAVVVDHIIPHNNDKKLFWDSGNWQALCKHCHDSWKKRLEMTGNQVGCDVDGLPIDPNHHWNQ